jgi:glycosyltransferase involved in cell wall biosynthesis
MKQYEATLPLEQRPQTAGIRAVDQAAHLAGMRVLIATESLGPINGVTRATEQLLTYLHARSVPVAAVAPEWQGGAPPNIPRDVPCVRLRGWPLPYNPELRVVTPFRLTRLYRAAFQPDLIYLASPASLGVQVWRQARRARIPMVANFQTDLGFYARLSLPAALGRVSGWGADRLHAALFRDPLVRAVLCPSSASRDYLLGLGVPITKIHIVRRGVDGDLFSPTKRNPVMRADVAPNGEIVLLCVARLSLEKGFDFLAAAYEAATRLARRRPHCPHIRLVVTGGNANPAIERTIQGYFTARGLDVHFTGTRTGEALAAIYASADLFVFPSRTETFGQVIQEAMASGLPVVARRQGGPADLVRPGATGALVEPGDVDGFAREIVRLVEQPELRARMGHTARAIAEKRGWDAVNAQIAHIMAEAL